LIALVVNIAVTLSTAAILVILFWGYRRKREEKRRRKQGEFTIPIDAGHIVTAGCLGVLGYLGLLFILVSLTLDLFERVDGPAWMNWVIAFGLIAGFFAMVGWAVFAIGSSYAVSRLVVDKQGIRLMRWRRTKTFISWDRPWQLERMTHQRRVRYRAFDYGTEYKLLMRLFQRKNELFLVFDVTGEEVGGLTPYEGPIEGHQIVDEEEWLISEINLQYERWAETPEKKPAASGAVSGELAAVEPGVALMNALDFSEEDLALNRKNQYAASQVSFLRRDQWLTLATYLVLAAIFGAGALNSVNRLFQGRSVETYVSLLIVCLLVTGFCLLMAIGTGWDVKTEVIVERVSGQIRLQHYPQSGEHWLRVGEEAFHITKPLFDALDDRAYYNFYVGRYGFGASETKLLSAEALAREGN
jgi:hypothetical protein